MRLAQEQDQGGAPEFNARKPHDRNMQVYDLKRQTAMRLAQEHEHTFTAGQTYERNMQILPPEQLQMQYQHPYVSPQVFAPVDSNRIAQDSTRFPHTAENRSFELYDGQGRATNASMIPSNLTQYVQHTSSVSQLTPLLYFHLSPSSHQFPPSLIAACSRPKLSEEPHE